MLVVSGLLGAAPACQQVLGLDRYDKVDASACSGTDCNEGGIDVITVEAGGDSGFELPDGAAEATSWAAWPMPNPPYDAGAWDRDAYPLNFENAGKTDAGPIVDKVTNLVWQSDGGSQAGFQTFEEAKAYCDGVTEAGLKWRLPTRIELVTLLDNTADAGSYVEPPFALKAGPYWTSSLVRPIKQIPPQFWDVDFSTALVTPLAGSAAAHVECVRAQ